MLGRFEAAACPISSTEILIVGGYLWDSSTIGVTKLMDAVIFDTVRMTAKVAIEAIEGLPDVGGDMRYIGGRRAILWACNDDRACVVRFTYHHDGLKYEIMETVELDKMPEQECEEYY